MVFLLIVNTCCGIYMFRQLTGCDDAACEDPDQPGKRFVLKDEYVVHGILLILVPTSVFIFLVIVMIKLLCFILVERKKSRHSSASINAEKPYGQFEDDSEDLEAVEAVVSVYFKIMDRVVYKTYKNPDTNRFDDPRNQHFMVQQTQCKLCLRYF